MSIRIRGKTGRTVFDEAYQRLYRLYADGHTVVVAFSAGKDSGVCLELAIAAARNAGRLPVHVSMRDEEVMLPGTFEYAERVAQRPEVDFRWCVAHQPIVNIFNRPHPYWWVFDRQLQPDQWVRQPPAFATFIDAMDIGRIISREVYPTPPDKDIFAVIGIRASESWVRHYSIFSAEGHLTKANAVGTRNCRPIYDWQDADVWRAVRDNLWDYNCNPAEAPIWMADFSFKPIGEVRAGDSIIGWTRGDDRDDRSTLQTAEVLEVHHKQAQVVKVMMESGRVIRCTPDHLWLAGTELSGNWAFRKPEVGRFLAQVIDPTPELDPKLTRTAGWLAGIYDGEGSYQRIYQHERDNGIYPAIKRALDTLGISYSEMNRNSPAQHGFTINGGRQGMVDFINWCRPVKLGQLAEMILGGRFCTKDRIISIEPELVRDVYALTTTTGNYVCWGYASKNSAYDVMRRFDIPLRMMRIAPPTLNTASVYLLDMARRAWPRWFDKVELRLPGVKTIAQFGMRAVLPHRRYGEHWRDTFLRECIEQAPAPWISERSRRVMDAMVGMHGVHASTDLPEISPCSVCHGSLGSWKALCTALYNGDPFALKTKGIGGMQAIEPEFFRTGAGYWGGAPTW